MGKQVTSWEPPDSDLPVNDTDPAKPAASSAWMPPDTDPVTPVKKKDEPVASSESGWTPPASDVSSEPATQPEQPSEKNTVQKNYEAWAQGRLGEIQKEYDTQLNKEIEDKQNSLDSELKSKYTPGSQEFLDARTQYERQVNAFANQRSKELADQFNTTFKTESGTKATEINQGLDELDKFRIQPQEQIEFATNKVRNPVETLGKTMWSTFRYHIPSAMIASLVATERAPDQLSEAVVKMLPEPVQDFLHKTQFEKPGQDYRPSQEAMERRKNLFRTAANLQLQNTEATKDLVNTLDKAEDFVDYINWGMYAFAQAAGQIPAAIVTRGGSAFGQEIGSIYMDGVQKIADEKGISPQEVIEKGLDDSLYPVLFGVAAGTLETIGAKGVGRGLVGQFAKKEVMQSFRDRALGVLKGIGKAGGIESSTEGTQTFLEQIGANRAAGETWEDAFKKVDIDQIIEATAQGGVGGSGLHAVGAGVKSGVQAIQQPAQQPRVKTVDQVISEKANIDITNPAEVKQAAAEIKQAYEKPTESSAASVVEAIEAPVLPTIVPNELHAVEGNADKAPIQQVPTAPAAAVVTPPAEPDLTVGNYVKRGGNWFFVDKDGGEQQVIDLNRPVSDLKGQENVEIAELAKVKEQLEAATLKGQNITQPERNRIRELPRNDIQTRVRGFFLDGGKLRWKSKVEEGKQKIAGTADETGFKEGERKKLAWIIDEKNGMSPEDIAYKLWDQHSDDERYSDQDYRNEVIELLSSEERGDWFANQRRDADEEFTFTQKAQTEEVSALDQRITDLENQEQGVQKQTEDLHANERRVYQGAQGQEGTIPGGETPQTEGTAKQEPRELIKQAGNPTASEQAVKDLQGLTLTHVPGLGMGQSKAKGSYVSTEKGGNRYATADQPAVKATVKIKAPFVTDRDQFATIQRAVINQRFGKETTDDLSDAELDLLAELLTEYFVNAGHDSIYFPESDLQEGELVVFDRKNVTLEDSPTVEEEETLFDTGIPEGEAKRVREIESQLTDLYKQHGYKGEKPESITNLEFELRELKAGQSISTSQIFKKPLASKNVDVEPGFVEELVPVDQIAPSQSTINKGYVRNPDPKYKPILIKIGEGKYIVDDGHHRVADAILSGKTDINADVLYKKGARLKKPPAKPPSPPATQQHTKTGPSQPGSRKYAITARIEASEAAPAIKRGVKERGDRYIPKGLDITNQEAKDLIALYGDKADGVVRDLTNGLTADTRVAMTAHLYDKYQQEGRIDEAVDIAMWQAKQSVEAGRAGNAAKIWKMITGTGEEAITLAIEKENEQAQQAVINPIREEVQQSREDIDREIRRLVEQKVQETVEERVKRTKLITKEKKAEISTFFDKLKVDTSNKGIVSASIIPGITVLPHVWNGAVEVIKQAVLTGADVANAIQAGIDYIKANQKEAFDEKDFTDKLTPQLERMIPKKPVKRDQIRDEQIKTPKLSGRKKKEFIDQVVQAYNDGKLTDQKFEKLYASKLGVRDYTTQERERIRDLAKTIVIAEKYEEELRKDFTRENIQKYKEYVRAAQDANRQLQQFAQAPNNIWDTLISIMQGNLLSTLSLAANVFYNVAYQPIRFLSTGAGSIVDFSLSQLAKMGAVNTALKDRTINMVALQKGYFKGGWHGTMEGATQLGSGTLASDKDLREISQGFSPSRAIDRWSNEDRTVEQKINDYTEGTIGWSAEVMFRLLNFGDKPWRRAAERARAYEIGQNKGLKGEELAKFMLLPDAASKDAITKAGDEATFQQSGPVSKAIQSGISRSLQWIQDNVPILGGPLKLILKAQMPYVKTPWNLIVETLDYAAPPLTLARGVIAIRKGDKREGSVLVGKAIVGAMIWSAAGELFIKGILTGDDDKEKKKRDFQQDKTPPPNSINLSALGRGLLWQGWETKDNDTWVSYSKMGIIGILFDNYTNVYKERISEGQDPHGNFVVDLLATAPRILSSALDQTFLQGTSALLEAIKDGGDRKTQNWVAKTTEAVASIAYPNTISTISKAKDEYLRDLEDDSFGERLENTFKNKMFMGDDLPAKVNLWGEKVRGNPEGRSKFVYYMFDPAKFENVDTEDFRYKLYQAYKTDYSADWLPSMPQRKITSDGVERKLSPEEYELYATYVGEQRADLVSTYMRGGSWNSDAHDVQKDKLKILYDTGYERGKRQFMQDLGMNVKMKFDAPIDIRLLRYHLGRIKPKI